MGTIATLDVRDDGVNYQVKQEPAERTALTDPGKDGDGRGNAIGSDYPILVRLSVYIGR